MGSLMEPIMPSYIARVDYVGDGTQTDFVFPFPLLDTGFIRATVSGVAASVTVPSPGVARITPAPADGAPVVISRQSGAPGQYLVNFTNAVEFSGAGLNLGYRQGIHRAEEAIDAANALVQSATDAAIDQLPLAARAVAVNTEPDNGKVLVARTGGTYGWSATFTIDESTGRATLGADPTAAMHAATKQYVDGRYTAATAYADGRYTAATQYADARTERIVVNVSSSVAEVVVDIPATWTGAHVTIIGAVITTPGWLVMQGRVTGAGSYVASGYFRHYVGRTAITPTGDTASASDVIDHIQLTTALAANQGENAMTGMLSLGSPSYQCSFVGHSHAYDAGGNESVFMFGGRCPTPGKLDRIRIFPSGGGLLTAGLIQLTKV